MGELKLITCEPEGQGVVELLDELMADAKAGKISSLAATVIDREGCASSCWTKVPSFAVLIGGVAILQDALMRRFKG